jgi:hypothetical protein
MFLPSPKTCHCRFNSHPEYSRCAPYTVQDIPILFIATILNFNYCWYTTDTGTVPFSVHLIAMPLYGLLSKVMNNIFFFLTLKEVFQPALRIRIRMFFGLLDPDPLEVRFRIRILLLSKNSKKNHDCYCFVTS